jgi:hypothetical protein
MATQVHGDTLTLCIRLEQAALTDELAGEALHRIKQLERLCAQMTDTGVILEEDVQDLIKADTWWSPEDGDYCFTDLMQGMQEIGEYGIPVEWCRAHTLNNGWAVLFSEVKDHTGRIIIPGGVGEYETYEAAEEAAADYQLRKRRAEYHL